MNILFKKFLFFLCMFSIFSFTFSSNQIAAYTKYKTQNSKNQSEDKYYVPNKDQDYSSYKIIPEENNPEIENPETDKPKINEPEIDSSYDSSTKSNYKEEDKSLYFNKYITTYNQPILLLHRHTISFPNRASHAISFIGNPGAGGLNGSGPGPQQLNFVNISQAPITGITWQFETGGVFYIVGNTLNSGTGTGNPGAPILNGILGVSSSANFRLRPYNNLPPAQHRDILQIRANNDFSVDIPVYFNVLPINIVTVPQNMIITFPKVYQGYDPFSNYILVPPASGLMGGNYTAQINILNSSFHPITNISTRLYLGKSSPFIIARGLYNGTSTSIYSGESIDFLGTNAPNIEGNIRILPMHGLSYGTYTDYLIIEGDFYFSVTIRLEFNVNKINDDEKILDDDNTKNDNGDTNSGHEEEEDNKDYPILQPPLPPPQPPAPQPPIPQPPVPQPPAPQPQAPQPPIQPSSDLSSDYNNSENNISYYSEEIFINTLLSAVLANTLLFLSAENFIAFINENNLYELLRGANLSYGSTGFIISLILSIIR